MMGLPSVRHDYCIVVSKELDDSSLHRDVGSTKGRHDAITCSMTWSLADTLMTPINLGLWNLQRWLPLVLAFDARCGTV